MKGLLSIVLLSSVLFAQAQPGELDHERVLQWIASEQVIADTFYHAGLFRTQRIYKKESYEDNTLFYSTLIADALSKLSPHVSREQSDLIDSIHLRVQQNAWRYRSRRGRPTYNFWQTDPDVAHPNGPEKYQRDKYKIPDDFDDTSTIGLLLDDGEEIEMIRNEMLRYTSERRKHVRTTFKRFKNSVAYGVWYADKWKQEFDICVMSNTLRFVFEKGFPLTASDSATVAFIRQSIQENLHVKHPYVLSPYYNKTAVILYHLANLFHQDCHHFFGDLKQQLIEDMKAELQRTEFEMHRVALYSSLLKMGESDFEATIDTDKVLQEANEFYWFSSNFMVAVGTRTLLRKLLNDSRMVPTFYWRSEAFYWTLYFEYLVLSNKRHTSISPVR